MFFILIRSLEGVDLEVVILIIQRHEKFIFRILALGSLVLKEKFFLFNFFKIIMTKKFMSNFFFRSKSLNKKLIF